MGMIALLFLFGSIARAADLVTINATDRGWYYHGDSDAGYHTPDVQSYLTGRLTGSETAEYRSFFVFDLTSVAGKVKSATLVLNGCDIVGGGTYNLYDFGPSILISTLRAEASNRGDIFADLGSGTSYGSFSFLESDAYLEKQIPLSAAFISAANSASGLFAIGGAVTNLSSPPSPPATPPDQYLFGYSEETQMSASRLIVETLPVPEPGSLVLVLTSAACLVAVTGRRTRRRVCGSR
jgi:hypothetical protein